jgi:hypothetical protein
MHALRFEIPALGGLLPVDGQVRDSPALLPWIGPAPVIPRTPSG